MFEGLFQPMHLLIIFFIALLVFGPKKLPELGKGLGDGIRALKEGMKDRETKEPAPAETTQLLELTRTHGLLIGKGGLYGNVIRLSPMLNIGKADVDEAVRILDKSFGELQL